MNLGPQRLAHKLILWLTVVAAIMAIVTSFVSARSQGRQIVNVMILGADQLSGSITSATWHAMLADHREDAYEQMETIAIKQGIDRIRMFNREGRVMFSTSAEDIPQVDKNAEVCSPCHASAEPLLLLDVESRSRVFRSADGERKLGVVTPIYNEPSCSNAACHAHPPNISVLGVLDVTMKLDAVDQQLADLQLRTPLITLLHIFLVSAVIVIITRQFVDRPIRRLMAATREVGAMKLDEPIEIEASAELEELADTFNVMRERLRDQIEVNRQFTYGLEQKMAERTQQLQVAHQKLLQSDRLASLGQLAASVAHEINNPIAGILNLSMLVDRIVTPEGLPPQRIPEVKRYLSQVVAETTRVGRIVTDLLAFSRRSKPQNVEIDLNVIVRSTLAIIGHKLELSNVEVVMNMDESLPHIRCDGPQIQQVVLNLVMNGAEATAIRGKGRVWITTRRGEEGRVVLEIADDGEGIEPESLPHVFDPFFTTKSTGKGVGLGLSVVYGILEAHGGEIEVASQPGKGTTFRVILPVAGAREAAARG